ncbi:MAG: hypothetical protein R3F42_05880 [Pseudomonadota bacterium]
MIETLSNRLLAGTCPSEACRLWPCLLAGLLLLSPALVRAEHFTPPSLEGYTEHTQRDADGDGDGVNETHIVTYMNPAMDSLFSMTTKGITWAWSLDTHDSDSGSSNYVIRDSDCDGVFDEVYGLDEEFHVPDCLR